MDRAQATQETSLADVLNSPLPTWPYVYCTPIVESYQYHFWLFLGNCTLADFPVFFLPVEWAI